MMPILNTVQRMFEGLCGNSMIGKVGLTVGAFITAYITPIVGLLTACFAFTIIDMIYGIKIAKKLGNKITSKKNWKGTLYKIRDEFTIVLLGQLLECTVMNLPGVHILTGGATVIICLTELWSILENLNTLDPEGPWKALGAFLKKKGADFIEFNLNDLKDGNNNDNPKLDEEQ